MKNQPGEGPPEYLIIGHITRDVAGEGYRPGGTALYGAITASRLGARTALYTSSAEDPRLEELEGIEVLCQRSKGTTTFDNRYTPQGRKQFLLDRADDLDLGSLPDSWRQARATHLAPVAGEIDLGSLPDFLESPLFLSLQGWLRAWDRSGLVKPADFPELSLRQTMLAGAFLSIEDLGNQRAQISRLQKIFPLLFLTLGSAGSELYRRGKMTPIPTLPVAELDPTGAGDIFAAALITLHAVQGKPLEESARLASRLAGLSVTRPGIAGVPSAQEIKDLLEDH